MSKVITQLPKPQGKFQVGVIHLNFVDETRIDPFPKAGGKNRDIPCEIWYPTESTEGCQPRPIMDPQLLSTMKEYPMYKILSKKICDVTTNSYEGAPLLTQKEKFPVILFNYGFSGFPGQNWAEMELLASNGFIVVSVGHPYDGTVSYPDGRYVGIDMDAVKALKKTQSRKDVKAMMQNFKKLQDPELSAEEVGAISRKLFGSGGVMEGKIDLWVDDVRFIAVVLEKLNSGEIKSIFSNKLDLEKGIGSYGHSYGGATSILASGVEARISCAINQDGGMYGAFNREYRYDKPVMFMESEATHGMSRFFFEATENDAYMLHIKKSKHMDYSDFPLITPTLILKLLMFGKINGMRMFEIKSQYVLAFFSKYLKGEASPLLEKAEFPEIPKLHKK